MLAVAGSTVSSITVYDTQQLVAVYRGGHIRSLNPVPPPAQPSFSQALTLGLEALTPSPYIHTHTLSSTMGTTGGGYGAVGPGTMGTTGGYGTSTMGTTGYGATGPSGTGCDQSAPVTGIAFCDDRPGIFMYLCIDDFLLVS